mmetsp:Transcript_24335/g.75125  ORF Transcript_24335/g.75125 Transcript_24335/m.75125 type:complete len:195 (+) Transcript_24335:685-1269(+)
MCAPLFASSLSLTSSSVRLLTRLLLFFFPFSSTIASSLATNQPTNQTKIIFFFLASARGSWPLPRSDGLFFHSVLLHVALLLDTRPRTNENERPRRPPRPKLLFLSRARSLARSSEDTVTSRCPVLVALFLRHIGTNARSRFHPSLRRLSSSGSHSSVCCFLCGPLLLVSLARVADRSLEHLFVVDDDDAPLSS